MVIIECPIPELADGLGNLVQHGMLKFTQIWSIFKSASSTRTVENIKQIVKSNARNTSKQIADMVGILKVSLILYDVTHMVIQWITSGHKNRNKTFTSTRNIIDNVPVNNAFLLEIIFILKVIKSHFKGSYEKQNLTPVVTSYDIYEPRRRLVS